MYKSYLRKQSFEATKRVIQAKYCPDRRHVKQGYFQCSAFSAVVPCRSSLMSAAFRRIIFVFMICAGHFCRDFTAASGFVVRTAIADATQQYNRRFYCPNAFIHNCRYRYVLYRNENSGRNGILRKQRSRSLFTRSLIRMMPEGPEVRTVVDQLQGGVGLRFLQLHFVSGRYGTATDDNQTPPRPDGFAAFQNSLTPWAPNSYAVPKPTTTSIIRTNGTNSDSIAYVDIITEWNCKGKFIYLLLDHGKLGVHLADDTYQRSLWITFGMTGRFLSESAVQINESQGKDSHIRWYMELMNVTSHKRTKIYYSDTRQFGTIKFCFDRQALAKKLLSLGPDMLAECMEQDFINILTSQKNQNMNICVFLMDQAKVCGIGNYILAEGLYRANIDPFASLSELNLAQQKCLYQELHAVTTESYRSQSTASNPDCFEYQCYGQVTCRRRGNPVRRESNGPHGRTIWYTDDQLFMPRSERDAFTAAKLVDYSENPASESQSQSSDAENSLSSKKLSDAETPGNRMLATLLSKKPYSITNIDIREESPQPRENVSVKADPATLVANLLMEIEEPGWKKALTDILRSSDSFLKVAQFLEEERANGMTIYPPSEEIFAALNLCPIDTVKVIIVGQDPYHRLGQGHGLAFSVRKGVRPPPSLQNVFKEVIEDVGIEEPRHGNLICWAKQGVLLLNAVLTVREGEANSHAGKGWEEVTDAIIRVVCEGTIGSDGNGLVFLLWGNSAFKKIGKVIPDKGKHVVLQSSHPSPLGATKTNSPFLGSKCFSAANTALIQMGHDPIDWSVE
jgi:uracil-DNA glycosylase